MKVPRTTEVPGHAGAMRVLRYAKGLPAGPNSSARQTLRQNDATGALMASTGVEPFARPEVLCSPTWSLFSWCAFASRTVDSIPCRST